MKKIMKSLFIAGLISFNPIAFSEDGHDHAGKKHCEKKVDGKAVHLEKVKDRKQCKQEGGRWVKAKKVKDKDHAGHKGGDHKEPKGHDDHKKEDGHKH